MEDVYVKIGETETEEDPTELLVEKDNSILLSSVLSQFPGATGLKYRNQESKTLRGLKFVDGSLFLPTENSKWKEAMYVVVYPKGNKRKAEDDKSNIKNKRLIIKCTDLIVLGLPETVTEGDLQEYFSAFGELKMSMIKHDHSGKSKGYGFIKYGNYEDQQTVMKQRHQIEGRWCDVKIPHSKEEPNASPKIYVGRITESLSKHDIKTHFEQYGDVDDVFIPTPFRAFAFVTFRDAIVAQSLFGEDQVINGVSVSINSANVKTPNRRNNYSENRPTTLMGYNNANRPSGDQNFYNHRQSGYDVTGASNSYMPTERNLTPANMDPSKLSQAQLATALGSWNQIMSGMLSGKNTMATSEEAANQRGANGGNNSQTGRGDSNAAWRNPQPDGASGAPGNWNMKY